MILPEFKQLLEASMTILSKPLTNFIGYHSNFPSFIKNILSRREFKLKKSSEGALLEEMVTERMQKDEKILVLEERIEDYKENLEFSKIMAQNYQNCMSWELSTKEVSL